MLLSICFIFYQFQPGVAYKKKRVKHFTEKPVLLDFKDLAAMFCPRLYRSRKQSILQQCVTAFSR